MFASIAPRYDRLNTLLSLGQDRRWRAALTSQLPGLRRGDRLLDLCTGTGDVALALARRAGPGVAVHASDFCEPMVTRAPAKAARAGVSPAFLVSDALALPYAAGRFRAVTVAFGLRNIQDPPAALAEMARVLEPGGRLLILEFSRPENPLFARVYRWYFFQVLPRLGRLLSGSPIDAYRYLPESVDTFPEAQALADRLSASGFRSVRWRYLTLGVVAIHVGER